MGAMILCPNCLSLIPQNSTQCPCCKHSLENTNPSGTLHYATLLGGRYTIGKHICTDGEGILYTAVDNQQAARVLIKEYFPVTLSEGRSQNGEIIPKEGSEVLFKTTRMDFEEIHRSIMRITPFQGLMTVLNVFSAHNTVYAVMECLEGDTLAQHLAKSKRRLPSSEARSLLQPIMEGVVAMHKAGLVHRGICPGNIIITSNGTARLCGYATIGLRTAESPLKCHLYEGFSAPEQYSAAKFEGRYTDVYGLAAVFYRLITGQRPESAQQRQVKDSLTAANRLEPNVPGYIAQVLDMGLELDPARRIQNVPELMGALMSPAAAENLLRRNPPKNQPEKESSAISAKSLFMGSLVVILVLLILVIALAIGEGSKPQEPVPENSVPATQQPVEIREVPDVVGISFRQVQNDPQYADAFYFVNTKFEYSSEFADGVIMEQSPQAKTTTTEEQLVIEVVVSMGPQMVKMPNIIGFPRESAEKELLDRGIKPSFTVAENDRNYASNSVVGASVQPGEMIDVTDPDNIVEVYVTKERVIYEPTAPEQTTEQTEPAPDAAPNN